MFNVGSQINVPAGHQADLSAITAHYKKRNAEMEDKQYRKQEELEAKEAEDRSNRKSSWWGGNGKKE